MLTTLIALILRIFSNPFSNVLQKKLTTVGCSALNINLYTYIGLFLLCLVSGVDLKIENPSVWTPAIMGGICGALGNGFLIQALKHGELSVLGPINSYKSVVAMIFGIILLGEIPSFSGLFGIIMIIAGTYFLFNGFSHNILKRKDIQYRVLALIFTAIEAVFIKNVILLSDIQTAFVMWCGFGLLFSLLLVILSREKISRPCVGSTNIIFMLICTTGIMQYSTNYIFNEMNVSYALALFQLSTIISVIFGWKFFDEKDIPRKIIGSVIMFFGAIVLILT